jgi:phospholipid/cholesterol/gamma-HCH transport system ATP-binding protein
MTIADYVYILADKQVVGHGTPAQLKQSDDPLIHQFLHGEADGPVPFHYAAASLEDDLLGSDHA